MNGLVHLAVETWAQGRFALFGEAFWAPRPQLRELRRTMGPSCAVLWSGDYQGLAGRRCSKASGADGLAHGQCEAEHVLQLWGGSARRTDNQAHRW